MNLVEKLFMGFTVLVCSVLFFIFCGSDASGSSSSNGIECNVECTGNVDPSEIRVTVTGNDDTTEKDVKTTVTIQEDTDNIGDGHVTEMAHNSK